MLQLPLKVSRLVMPRRELGGGSTSHKNIEQCCKDTESDRFWVHCSSKSKLRPRAHARRFSVLSCCSLESNLSFHCATILMIRSQTLMGMIGMDGLFDDCFVLEPLTVSCEAEDMLEGLTEKRRFWF